MSVARKTGIALLVLLALVVLPLLALVLLVNPDDFRPEIEAKAREQGIDLQLAGEIGWAFWPRPGFSLADIGVGVPVGQDKLEVKAGELTLALDVPALFSRKLQVSQLALRDASTTWPPGETTAPWQLQLHEAVLQDVNVEGTAFPVQIAARAQREGLQAEVDVDMQLGIRLAAKQYTVQGLVATVEASGEGVSPALRKMRIQWQQLALDAPAHTLRLTGLAAGAGPVKLAADIAVTGMDAAPEVMVQPLSLTLDGGQLQGKAQYRAGNVPWLMVDLNGDRLDLDHLQAALAGQPAAPDESVPAPAAGAPADTAAAPQQPAANPDAPLALAGAVALPGDYRLGLQQLVVNHLQWQKVLVSAQVKDQHLTLRELRAEGYQGQVKATGSLHVPVHGRPDLILEATMTGLSLPPFLQDLQQQPSKVGAGQASFDARLRTQPVTRNQLIGTLNGLVNFNIDGLVINELNIEQRVCEAAAKVEGKTLADRAWPAHTAFRESSGKARISNGVVQLSPVVARLDTLDLRGSGPVDLLQQTLDLPLDLMLVDDPQAANFCEVMNPRLAEITWPLRCRGNYATQQGKDLCGIDRERLDELVAQAARQKLEKKVDEKLKEKFGDESERLKEGLRNLFNR